MARLVVLIALIGLAASSAAQAQSSGGGHGHYGQGAGATPNASSPYASPDAKPPPPPKPISDAEIVGVVQAVDPASKQVTIAYEAVAARNWPPGTMPFEAYKSSLLNGVSVGEKVRFKLDGQRITEIAPY